MIPPSSTDASRGQVFGNETASGSVARGGSGVASAADLTAVMRGLSAIFWGLPLALLAFARHFLALWPTGYDLLFPPLAAGLLLLGAWRMGRFQPQERVWQEALLRVQLLAVMMLGLAPFLFLWTRLPNEEFYSRAVVVLLAVSFGFLMALMRALRRLSAMLPDPTAESDARMFEGLSNYVVVVLLGSAVLIYVRLSPIALAEFLALPRQPFGMGRQAILLLLLLLPVAMAMAVAWKLKEVVVSLVIGVASARHARARTPGG